LFWKGVSPAGRSDSAVPTRGEDLVTDEETSASRLAEEQRVVGGVDFLLVSLADLDTALPRAALPRAARAGTPLKTAWDGEKLLAAEVDHIATQQARARIAEKLARLRQRGRK